MCWSDWRKCRLLFVHEWYLAWAIEAVRRFTGTTFGYEFSFKFADSNVYSTMYLGFTIITCVTCSFLADNFIGKYMVTLVGIIFLIGSGVCFVLQSFLKAKIFIVLSYFLVIVYMGSSETRNVYLLEQMEDPKRIRKTIFLLLYLKVIWRCVFNIDMLWNALVRITGRMLMASFVIALIYFVSLIVLGRKIKVESVLKFAWCKCFVCFCRALLKRKKKKEATSTEDDLEHQLYHETHSMFIEHPDHWLYNARPKSSIEVIENTILYYKILPFVILGFLTTNLMYFVQIAAAAQRSFFIQPDLHGNEYVLCYSLAFELFALPYVEFGIIRFTQHYRKKAVIFVIVGYCWLLMASLVVVAVTFTVRPKPKYASDQLKDYLLPLTSQLNIINTLNDTLIFLPPFTFSISIKSKGIAHYVLNMKQGGSTVDHDFHRVVEINKSIVDYDITRFEQKSSSYFCDDFTCKSLFSENESIPDPVTYKNRFISHVVKLDCVILKEKEKLNTQCGKTKYSHMLLSKLFDNGTIDFNYTFSNNVKEIEVLPSMYNIYIFDDKTAHKVASRKFIKSSMYLIVSYANDGYQAKIHVLDPPLILQYPETHQYRYSIFVTRKGVLRHVVLIQLGMAVIGHCFATVAYFSYLFMESPPKLRCSVFSLLFILKILNLAAYNYMYVTKFTAIAHFSVHLLFFSIFLFLAIKKPTLGYVENLTDVD